MHLVVLSSPHCLSDEDSIVRELFRSGLKTLHVRKPQYSETEYRQYIERIPDRFHRRLMLHSHHQLAAEYNIKGIHYTETTRPKKITRTHPDLSISTSFHSVEQLDEDYGALDYAFLSPVFDSISKSRYYSANFDTVELCTVLNAVAFPVLALGGIDSSKIEIIHKLGFKGAAILGAVWSSTDPINRFIEIQSKFENV